MIDLLQSGLTTKELDQVPEINVSDWMCARSDCESKYYLKAELRNANQQVLQIYETGELDAPLQPGWKNPFKKIDHTFKDYGKNLRFIYFEHGGKDTKWWKGHYGSKMTGASVKVYSIPSETTSSHKTFLPSETITFDGQDDYVNLGNPDILNFVGQITIEAWIKPQNITKTQNIVAHGYHRNPDAEVFLRIAEAEHEYQIGFWNGNDHRVGYSIPDEDIGTWVHLAGSYDGAAWKLYRNGIKVSESIEATGVLQVNANWAIAAAGNGTERFFHGQISEVRIWNKACSQQEIQENQFRQLKGNELGLVGYWPLDEGKGTTTQDRTSNGNLGQIAGAQWSKTTEQEIAALVQLLQSITVDDNTRRLAAESLGKIGTGNEIAIAALVQLL